MRPTPLFLPLTLATTIKVAAQQNPGDQLWVYNTGSSVPVEGSPAVGQDGTIYVVAPGTLSAVTNGGSNKWNFPLDIASHGGYSSPAVASDGTVYVSSGKLYAIKPNGSQKWAYQADSENGSPGIGLDQTVYIHGYHLLHAVSSAGTLLWTNRIGGTYIYGSPSLASGRSIYAPNPETGILYALDPPGTTKWMASGIFGESPAIGANGTVYLTSGGLYAFSPEGTNLWVFRTNSFPGTYSPGSSLSVSIANDGTIYAPSFGAGSLYAISPTGGCKWRTDLAQDNPTNAPVAATPAIDASGTILYPAFNTLYAISPIGSVQWTFSPHDGAICQTSPAIGPDGTIYVTFGSKLYAIYNTNRLADSPWPMFRQNARHTGKVEKPSLQKPQKRADANFEFQVYAQIDQTQTVQTSMDLVTWAPLTNVVVTNVPMDVVDLCASNFPIRFYRTLSQ